MTDKTTSFVAQLCFGSIEEDLILPYPKMKAAEQETFKNIRNSIEQLLKPHEKDFREWDAKGEFPESFIEELKQFGLFSLIIPEAYGGMGLSTTAYSRTLQELASYDGSVAVTIGAHSSIGMRGLLLFGSDHFVQYFFVWVWRKRFNFFRHHTSSPGFYQGTRAGAAHA